MPKQSNSTANKPTEKQLLSLSRGTPFKQCEQCGVSIPSSACYCSECLRTLKYNTPSVKQFQPSNDTQRKQSNTAFNRKGYRDKIPTTFPTSRKERV